MYNKWHGRITFFYEQGTSKTFFILNEMYNENSLKYYFMYGNYIVSSH